MIPQSGTRTPAPHRRGSLARTVKTMAWSLIGIRKGSEYREDLEKVNPLHLIAVGLVAIFLLVAALVALVHWIV